MAAVDYEKTACSALGLMHKSEAELGEYLNLGFFKPIEAQPAALAACGLRTARTGAILDEYSQKQDKATDKAVNAVKSQVYFMSFDKYLSTLKNINRILKADQKLTELNDKINYIMEYGEGSRGQRAIKVNELFKQIDTIPMPTSEEIWFLPSSNCYKPEIHTPDFNGYMEYVKRADIHFNKICLRKKIPVLLNETDHQRHTYITGGSGSGKSELLKSFIFEYATPPAAEASAAVVVIEPHGDMSQEISRWRCFANNGRLVYIDPNLFDDLTPVFNPLELPHGVNPDIYVQQLVAVFVQLLEGSGGDSLTVNMRAVLIPALKVLLSMKNSDLHDLLRFMQTDGRATLYIEAGKKSPDKFVSEFFTYDFQDSKFDPTKAALATKVSSILNTEAERRLFLGKSSIDLVDLINKKKVLVFRFSKGLIGQGAARSFGRFILAALESTALRRAETDKAGRVPVHVFVDECHNYITESIESILQESRKYGLFLTLAQQNCGFGMSSALKRVMLGNTHIKATGGNQDMETLTTMANIAGVDVDTLRGLTVGQFFLKVGAKEGFVLAAPSNLITKDGKSPVDMTAEEWERVRQEQRAYYQPITEATAAGGETAARDKANEPPLPLV